MNKWKLCAVAFAVLLTASTCFSQVPQNKEKVITSSADSQILWQFDTGG
jgi:hypothetical protein